LAGGVPVLIAFMLRPAILSARGRTVARCAAQKNLLRGAQSGIGKATNYAFHLKSSLAARSQGKCDRAIFA
jgi:hypothetical protein